MSRFRFFLSLSLCCLVYAQSPSPSPINNRRKVTRLHELPGFTYPVPGRSVSKLIQSPAPEFAPFANQVRKDIDSVLSAYDIQDKAMLRDLHLTLLLLDLLEGKDDDARREVAIGHELEDKSADRLMGSVYDEANLAARRDANGNPTAFRKLFSHYYSEAIDRLPWDIVGNLAKEQKGRLELSSAAQTLGYVRSTLDPAAQRTGTISGDAARSVVAMRAFLLIDLPLRDERVEVLSSYIAAHHVDKPDIWARRQVTLTPGQKLTPVAVGIWDFGVDLQLFPKQMLYTDGRNGIAFDVDGRPSSSLLRPLDAAQMARYPEVRKLLKGYADLQASLDTAEASALKRQVAALGPDEVRPFFEELSLFANYVHGTHVAGIVVAGNPYVRLAVARMTFDYHSVRKPFLLERSRQEAENYKKTIAFFRANHVRVVNMSWANYPKWNEDAMEANGIGKDAADRRRMAQEFFNICKQALEEAMRNSPEILFICAAGNSNTDSTFNEYIPSSLSLPNLVTVGAVDKAGDETSFTSYGPTVRLYANGYEVESTIPGGGLLADSGTSMASPQVANLAAKLIAIDPSLTPLQAIALLKQGATRSENGRFDLINPKRSIELLRTRHLTTALH